MSFANYGPDNQVPITANGDPTVETPLFQTAANAEVPLVLGEGVWAITARCAIYIPNAAGTYQLIQASLYDARNLVAHAPMAFGADIRDALNPT